MNPLDMLTVILYAMAPIIILGGALFLVGGVLMAIITPFILIVRVGIPRI